jgi:hypothetical protein
LRRSATHVVVAVVQGSFIPWDGWMGGRKEVLGWLACSIPHTPYYFIGLGWDILAWQFWKGGLQGHGTCEHTYFHVFFIFFSFLEAS